MEVAEPDPLPRPPEPPRTLPVDLLLEIVARCDGDAKTVVRCGLVCKALRRAMLDPGFHARLGRRAGFDPGLLVAVSYRLSGGYGNNEGTAARPIDVVQPPGRLPRFDANLLGTLEPTASSRDGLLVLRKNEMMLAIPKCRLAFPDGGLQVCNTITGHVTSLPPPSSSTSTSAGIVLRAWYQPALLSVDDDAAGRSFELLLMCGDLSGRQLVTQTFSSKEGEWGAARKIMRIQNLRPGARFLYEASSTAPPAVVGRSVHWLCYTDPVAAYLERELIILAVRADDEESASAATLIKLPQEFTSYPGRFMLAATATTQGERRLSLLAAETLAISMWTLVLGPDEGSSILWSRQEVIRMQEIDIDRPLTGVLHANQAIIWFSMFGERSGTVLFWMQTGDADQHQVILVQLNLVTKKTMVLWRGSGSGQCRNYIAHALLHETGLISVLKSF